ncbi:MAG TPA: ATP-binding cassette domain-containing protein [Chloroflexota bacterium]|nr:ATP-binding cassette domain-containing protein [Chloroflexota bacterium]
MYCSTCGGLNDTKAAYCAHCGRPFASYAGEAILMQNGVAPQATPAPPPPTAALVFAGPPRRGQRIELRPGAQYTLGRAGDNAVVIDDASVSRTHARVRSQAGVYLAEDLHSRNGTWVNDREVAQPTPLRHGDVLRLGNVELQFEEPGAAWAAARAPTAASAPADAGDYLELADGQRIPLSGSDIYIGRAPNNDLVLDEATISRQHARLQRLPQGWLLTDLESSNGTRVNDQLLAGPVFLTPSDCITFGDLTLTYHQSGVADQAVCRTRVSSGKDGALVVARDERSRAPLVAPSVAGAAVAVLQSVSKTYHTSAGSLNVLKSVSLVVQAGEFVAIVGPSGCGKSTLLNVITGIDRPDSGQVTVQGQDILSLGTDALARWRGRNLGIVFQFFQLLPTLTVAENVMLPMAFCGTYRGAQRRARAMEVLRLVGMDPLADRLPSALSGGQQQRVAIARALANDPPVLVADEPTGNLDSVASQQMFELFVNLVAHGKTVLMVTHDPVLARGAGRRVEMLDGAIV